MRTYSASEEPPAQRKLVRLHRPYCLLIICLLSVGMVFTACSRSDPSYDQRPDFPWEFVRIAELDTGNEKALLGFHRYDATAIRPDGTVFIATDAWAGIHEFNTNGRWIRNLGGEGNGPGEYQKVKCLAASPTGRLAIYDTILRKVSFLEGSGEFSTSIRLNLEFTLKSNIMFAGDERLWVFTIPIGQDSSPTQIILPSISRADLILYSAGGDTLHVCSFPDSKPFLVIAHNETPLIRYDNPEVGAPKWAVSPDGTAWLLTPNCEQLIRISSETGKSDTLAVKYSAPVFTNEQWSQLVEVWTDWMREAEGISKHYRSVTKTIRKLRESLSPVQRMWWIDEYGLLIDRMPNLGGSLVERSLWRYAAVLGDGSMTKDIEGPADLITAGYGYAIQKMYDPSGLPKLILWKLVPKGS